MAVVDVVPTDAVVIACTARRTISLRNTGNAFARFKGRVVERIGAATANLKARVSATRFGKLTTKFANTAVGARFVSFVKGFGKAISWVLGGLLKITIGVLAAALKFLVLKVLPFVLLAWAFWQIAQQVIRLIVFLGERLEAGIQWISETAQNAADSIREAFANFNPFGNRDGRSRTDRNGNEIGLGELLLDKGLKFAPLLLGGKAMLGGGIKKGLLVGGGTALVANKIRAVKADNRANRSQTQTDDDYKELDYFSRQGGE